MKYVIRRTFTDGMLAGLTVFYGRFRRIIVWREHLAACAYRSKMAAISALRDMVKTPGIVPSHFSLVTLMDAKGMEMLTDKEV